MSDLSFSERVVIATQSNEASQEHLIRRTLTILDRHSMENGSGTIFRIGDRVLIATAGHIIGASPTGRLWPLVLKPRHSEQGMPGYASFKRHSVVDVGYLEVHPEAVNSYFEGQEFASLDEIELVGTGRLNKSLIVVGSPSKHAEIEPPSIHSGEYVAKVLNFWAVTIAPELWPTNVKEPLDQSLHFLVDYPSNEQMLEAGFGPLDLPHPGGLSGGGFWDQGFNSGELWHPQSARLVAIQSSWDDRNRFLRGIQIVHWLKLLWDNFDDLRESIIRRFPNQDWGGMLSSKKK